MTEQNVIASINNPSATLIRLRRIMQINTELSRLNNLLQARVLELTDERDNLATQLTKFKARHQRYVERAKQLLHLVGGDDDLDEDAQWKHL